MAHLTNFVSQRLQRHCRPLSSICPELSRVYIYLKIRLKFKENNPCWTRCRAWYPDLGDGSVKSRHEVKLNGAGAALAPHVICSSPWRWCGLWVGISHLTSRTSLASPLQKWEAGNRAVHYLEGCQGCFRCSSSSTGGKALPKGSVLPPVPPQLQCPPAQDNAVWQTPSCCSGLPPTAGSSKGNEQMKRSGTTAGTASFLGECPEFVGSPWLGRKKPEGEIISQGCNYSREVLKWNDEC